MTDALSFFRQGSRVYCVGIGGIGLSGLARLLHRSGVRVSGSDLHPSIVTEELETEGIAISLGHSAARFPRVDAVIRSQAIPPMNEELRAAKERGIPVLTYPEAVAAFVGRRTLIAVAGTHGKTTTTSLIGVALRAAGLDPTILVGSRVPQFGGNAVLGKGHLFVLEADEYARSFLAYRPTIAVVTNIDADHLDTYRDLDDITKTFGVFLRNVSSDGTAIVNAEDASVTTLLKTYRGAVRTFGVTAGTTRASDVDRMPSGTRFLVRPDRVVINLPLMGIHNVRNALAAYAVGRVLDIDPKILAGALASFQGSWRRFERVGEIRGAPVIADYGHHPTEILATIDAVRQAYPLRRLVLVFQPHHAVRLQKLFPDFVRALSAADVLILAPLYLVVGRETEPPTVTIEDLGRAIGKHRPAPLICETLEAAAQSAERVLRENDVLVLMGAGDVHRIASLLRE